MPGNISRSTFVGAAAALFAGVEGKSFAGAHRNITYRDCIIIKYHTAVRMSITSSLYSDPLQRNSKIWRRLTPVEFAHGS